MEVARLGHRDSSLSVPSVRAVPKAYCARSWSIGDAQPSTERARIVGRTAHARPIERLTPRSDTICPPSPMRKFKRMVFMMTGPRVTAAAEAHVDYVLQDNC